MPNSVKAMPKSNVESFTVTVDLIKNYAIFTTDIEGVITSWNDGAVSISGYEQSKVLGLNFSLLYTEPDIKQKKPLSDLDHAAMFGSMEDESQRIKSDGKLFLANTTITQIHDEKTNEPVGYIHVVKDDTARRKTETDQIDANSLLRQEIIKRKKIEVALNESNAELEAFASAASHDLQEPLRMVISYLQLIDRRYRAKFDKDGKEFLEFAVDGAMRMRTLISDLVEYSRIDTLAKPFHDVNMNELVTYVLRSLSMSVNESGVEITSDDLPTVWGDEVRLNQLMQNLIANAIKFSDKPVAKIHIGVEKKANEYVFSVKDNGMGIRKKDNEKIFLIFKQLASRKDRQGSGVGLAISKKIVNRHYGKIWVESKEGKGSVFYFTIPYSILNKEQERKHE